MNIKKMCEAFEKHTDHFHSDDVLKQYKPLMHRMLMKEEDIAKFFHDENYLDICHQLERDFCDVCTFDQIEYERILNRSDTN